MSAAPEPGPLRPPDWAESADAVAALRAGKQYALLIATEHMTRLSVGWRPPTARQASVYGDLDPAVNACLTLVLTAASSVQQRFELRYHVLNLASIASISVRRWRIGWQPVRRLLTERQANLAVLPSFWRKAVLLTRLWTCSSCKAC